MSGAELFQDSAVCVSEGRCLAKSAGSSCRSVFIQTAFLMPCKTRLLPSGLKQVKERHLSWKHLKL